MVPAAVESAFAGAGEAAYSSATVCDFTPDGRPYVQKSITRVASSGALTSLRTVVTNPTTTDSVVGWEIDAADLLEVASYTIVYQPREERHFKRFVRDLGEVEGRLFPLQPGNQMTLRVVRVEQAVEGAPDCQPRENVYEYRFEVTGREAPPAFTSVPGAVYSIRRSETAPDGFVDVVDLLYAESIGKTLRESRAYEDGTSERRVVVWR